MIKYDYHMHSQHSGDSDTPSEGMIKRSIELGLKQICFTEHYDPFFPYYIPEEKGMFELDLVKYFGNIDELSHKYKSQIKVLHGIEIGMQPDILDYCTQYIKNHPFDFVICSSHVAGKTDPYYPVYFEGRTPKEAITFYFEEILRIVSNYNEYDVYGHLDYVVRYTDLNGKDIELKDYYEIIEAILKTIIGNGKGIEINTGGLITKLNRINPHIEIVKLYKELGGEIITVGSDAHTPEYVAKGFDTAKDLLKEAGFNHHTIFEQRKYKHIDI